VNDLDKYFIFKCRKGLKERGLENSQLHVDQLNFEMKTIIGMKFPGYFLIVQDIINWAKKEGILVGPGRGSAAGSVASYCLKITDLDPLRWGLLFERFLNPDRISMPDIDMDFEDRFRHKVIKYIMDRFGHDRVAHIGTFGTMKARSAIKSAAKTLGHPYAVGDKLSKLLLAPIHGKNPPIKESIEKVPELYELRNSNGTEAEILRWAEKIENMVSNYGVHAAGVVISNEPLAEKVPMFKSKEGETTTQWEMNNIEQVGLIKFDILGLDALTKIHNCLDIIEYKTGERLDISKIPLDDEAVFNNLKAGDTVGVFQLEASSGIRDILVQMRPSRIEDIFSLVAIYRPGPLDAEYKETYFGVKAGTTEPTYLVEELEDILGETEGWLIYQEQCMSIAKVLCGYTGGQADELRKAIGKKIPSLMAKHESLFKDGWVKNGLPQDKGNQMWNQMVGFAAYGFNKAHAASYGMITYQTAWLKAHYPTEFMCSVMISVAGNQDKIIKCLSECKRIGIKVLSPDINNSQNSFWVDADNNIRFGLGPTKNVGKSAEIILEERKLGGKFRSLRDFCERVDLGIVNRKKIESLIRAGAFDCFEQTRASLLESVELIWEYRDELKKYESKLKTFEKKSAEKEQRDIDIAEGKLSNTGRKLKPLKEPVRPDRPTWPEMVEIDELPQSEMQQNEHELLGFYVTSHPLDALKVSEMAAELNTIEDTKQLPRGAIVSIAAVIANKNEITTKSKKKMAFLQLEDLTGMVEAVCFPSVFNRFKDSMVESQPLRIHGKVEVTETDDDRVSKLIVSGISVLEIKRDISPRKIDACVSLARANELRELLNTYAGDKHEVSIILQSNDGTCFRMPSKKIGNYRGKFMRELARLNNE
jgi:DNA polymerase-3 subunit alpha